jgi:hypothetical protein
VDEAVKEANSRRIAALWECCREFGRLSTSAIESGVVNDMFKMIIELQECSEYSVRI